MTDVFIVQTVLTISEKQTTPGSTKHLDKIWNVVQTCCAPNFPGIPIPSKPAIDLDEEVVTIETMAKHNYASIGAGYVCKETQEDFGNCSQCFLAMPLHNTHQNCTCLSTHQRDKCLKPPVVLFVCYYGGPPYKTNPTVFYNPGFIETLLCRKPQVKKYTKTGKVIKRSGPIPVPCDRFPRMMTLKEALPSVKMAPYTAAFNNAMEVIEQMKDPPSKKRKVEAAGKKEEDPPIDEDERKPAAEGISEGMEIVQMVYDMSIPKFPKDDNVAGKHRVDNPDDSDKVRLKKTLSRSAELFCYAFNTFVEWNYDKGPNHDGTGAMSKNGKGLKNGAKAMIAVLEHPDMIKEVAKYTKIW
jgi:hypothetical protein